MRVDSGIDAHVTVPMGRSLAWSFSQRPPRRAGHVVGNASARRLHRPL